MIRPFRGDDLPAIHRILREAFGVARVDSDAARAERGAWLEWNRLNAEWFPRMTQPPYGDRAVILRETGEVVGAVGYVPHLMPFDQIPELARTPGPRAEVEGRPSTPTRPFGTVSAQDAPPPSIATMSAEIGLFWAIDPARQRQGYATEAALALIAYAFDHLRLWRIVAKTLYDNHASQAVMRKAGMTLTRNPLPHPEWMQVVGVRYAD